MRLGQEDRAESIPDGETRVERRRQVEQRIQQVVPALAAGLLALDSVVLKRADPVHIREQRVIRERGLPHHLGIADVQHLLVDL